MIFFLESLMKIGITLVLTFITSIEREFHSHPGGITTHMLVGLASCMFTILSIKLQHNDGEHGDVTRIASQVVSGMGFLGSATVYKSDNYVKGINTAASLWVATAIGMSVGGDLWELAVLGSGSTALILLFNHYYKKCMKKVKIDCEHSRNDESNHNDLFIDEENN